MPGARLAVTCQHCKLRYEVASFNLVLRGLIDETGRYVVDVYRHKRCKHYTWVLRGVVKTGGRMAAATA